MRIERYQILTTMMAAAATTTTMLSMKIGTDYIETKNDSFIVSKQKHQ